MAGYAINRPAHSFTAVRLARIPSDLRLQLLHELPAHIFSPPRFRTPHEPRIFIAISLFGYPTRDK
jgi:hypothetical protein